MNKMLQFPAERINFDPVHIREQCQGHQAKVLPLPVKPADQTLLLPYAVAVAWISLFGF